MKHLPEVAVIVIFTAAVISAMTLGHSRIAVADDTAVVSKSKSPTKSVLPPKSKKVGLSLEAARDRAEVLHDVYASTLDVMHERYFHGARAMVPARAMQDVFSSIQRKWKIEANWISVNMKPMSIDHEPKSDFEKQAAKAISAGKSHFEIVEDGFYRRAGAIPLNDGCIGCHAGFSKKPTNVPKFAALVINVPLGKHKPVPSK